MLRFLLVLVTSVFVANCQPLYKADRNYEVFEKNEEFFQTLMNSQPETTSAKSTIVLEDPSYPIALQLYKDGRFFYHLKRLGDGWGTWSYKNGFLTLYAERKIFVMNFEIHGIEPNGSALSLEFSDRFGPKFLRLQKILKN